LLAVSVGVCAMAAACTKSETGQPTAGSANATTSVPAVTASASATTAASASASASASAATADTATTTATDAGKTTDTAKKDGGATTAASASNGAGECGTKPLPDCPLQGWMKTNANPPVMAGDTAALAPVLEKIVAFAPGAGYPNWASIAKDGAAAAKSGDLTAAKASCRTCHDQYKQKYKNEIRTRKI